MSKDKVFSKKSSIHLWRHMFAHISINITSKNINYVASIISYFFILLSLYIIVLIPPTQGYELSIYDVYPLYFWILLIGAIFISELVIFRSILYQIKDDNSWIFSFIAIIIIDSILLFMPIIRGYSIYGRDDVLSHIGHINDIINNSHVGINNIYPILHILVAIIVFISGISPEKNASLIPAVLSLFFIVSIYHLSKLLFEKKDITLFIFMFSSLLLFENAHLMLATSVQAFFLLPFLMYLYFKCKENQINYSILLVIYIVLIGLFHPLSILFISFLFFVITIYEYIYQKMLFNKGYIEVFKLKYFNVNIIILCLTIFFAWYFSYSYILNSFSYVLKELFYAESVSSYDHYNTIITKVNPSILDLIDISFRKYGIIALVSFYGTLFSAIDVISFFRNSGCKFYSFHKLLFSFSFLAFEMLCVIFFFNDFIVGFERVFIYSTFFGIIVISLGFQSLISHDLRGLLRSNSKRILKFKVLFLVLTLSIFLTTSVFFLYPSPIINMQGEQVSQKEIIGFNWFLLHRNENIESKELAITQVRLFQFEYGRLKMAKNIKPYNSIVAHFGYDQNSSLGNSYPNGIYFLLPEQGINLSRKLFPKQEESWSFFPMDFKKFAQDSSVEKTYDNKGIFIFYIPTMKVT